MKINCIITNLNTHDLTASKAFYTRLFDFTVNYNSDWFVQLLAAGGEGLEIGLIKSDHELIPMAFRGQPNGMYITLVVNDAVRVFAEAQRLNHTIVQEPELTFYGQMRVLLKDPAGVLVDVSSPHQP